MFGLHHNDKLVLFINISHHPHLVLKDILWFLRTLAFGIKASLATGYHSLCKSLI
jgi:hypothetical protein